MPAHAFLPPEAGSPCRSDNRAHATTWHHETPRLPDRRTAYFGDDGDHVALFMYVAGRPEDLSAGTLYAARWNQVSGDGAGAATLDWVKLGHATDAGIRAIIDSGVTFDDIFDATTAKATPDWEAMGYRMIRAGHSGDEILSLKDGMEKAAAHLESCRYAAWLGEIVTGPPIDEDRSSLTRGVGTAPTEITVSSDHRPIPDNRPIPD